MHKSIGYQTRYRNASNELQSRLAQHDQYTMNELDDIYFSQAACEAKKEMGSRRASHCGIGTDGRFENKTEFLKQLNELLSYTAPKDGLRSKYNKLIRKGQQQEFVDLSLLKKMDSHLEWAMEKHDNRSESKKEQMDASVRRFLQQDRDY